MLQEVQKKVDRVPASSARSCDQSFSRSASHWPNVPARQFINIRGLKVNHSECDETLSKKYDSGNDPECAGNEKPVEQLDEALEKHPH